MAASPEGWKGPQHPWSDVFEAVFFGTAYESGPVHCIEAERRRGALHQRHGPLSEDTMGYAMQRENVRQSVESSDSHPRSRSGLLEHRF